MATAVSNFITKILCENQGRLDYKQLYQKIRQTVTVVDSLLFDVLSDRSKFVITEGKQKAASRALGADSVIVAKTSLRLCQKLPNDCNNCGDLHLCRYFVCGNCKYRNKCKNSHDLDSAYNRGVLRAVGLQELGEAALFCLLLQNDSYLLPEICSHYNKGNGEHGSCRYKEGCTNLHVCQHFLQGDCKFGAACKRSHTFGPNTMKILSGRGVSPENMRILHEIYKNRFAIAHHAEKPAGSPPAPPPAPAVKERSRKPSSNSISEADSNEICLFFIRRHCSFKEKCVRVHYHLPYRWQVLSSDGSTWKDLPNMEDIEKAYCNPKNSKSQGSPPVDFLTMTFGAWKVRRLSTASAVTKPPHYILTTEWLWYWQDEHGTWSEYGQEANGKTASSITSQSLENVYLADVDKEVQFSAGNQHYVLNFKDMFQQNCKYNTKREIRRRPRFLSAQEVEKKLKKETPETSSSTAVCVPQHWDKAALPDFTYKLVTLSSSTMEYRQVEQLFKQTMPASTIHSIQRVQNPSLWRVFQWQKEQMQKKNGGKAVDERLLFHGTEQSLIAAICEQNFDWRICGVHGTMYGKGSYFARDAAYSDRYTRSNSKTKSMFVVLVLVGEFTRGATSYLRPPEKGTNQGFYDSCVDSKTNPTIFVVFEKHQIYPEFIIEYS
ncbi:protein mono-ADP-ribosyltransferase PARP12-like [Megalops cyprinoides]|uniref:protein mono-ADP-ribosyltransferase PARP12-like n=1 Tax=Megalops cyprinoides TaxID=118141 RepID=UPI001864FBB3|nr:protein mono-ADP-ribosyltransferase PARP12-like [Megalops cyprinoides]